MSIVIGEFKTNVKYGGGSTTVTMDPVLFKSTFTYGVQKSKFDNKKFTMTLCLSEEQKKMVNKIKDDVFKTLMDQDIAVEGVKDVLYGDSMYVKVDPDLFSAYDESDDEIEFTKLLTLKNFNANIAVDVSSVFIKDDVTYLQLYLNELVVLEKAKKEKVKRKRVVF